MRRKLFAIAVLAGGLFVIPLAVVVVPRLCREDPANSRTPIAEYDNFEIWGHPDFYELVTSSYNSPMGKVYVELPDQRRFLLSELPEEVAAESFEGYTRPSGKTCYSDGRSSFSYRNGKLVFAKLHELSDMPCRISSREDGPYVAFPFDRKTLLEVFGEPLSWRLPGHMPCGP